MSATLTVSTPLCATRLDVDFTSSAPAEQQRAKAICAGCPGMLACREEALQRRLFDAVRGGLTGRELRTLDRGVVRPAVAIHNRARYVSGQCACDRCKAANAAYMAKWRARRVVTQPRTVVFVIEPNGQMALEVAA